MVEVEVNVEPVEKCRESFFKTSKYILDKKATLAVNQ